MAKDTLIAKFSIEADFETIQAIRRAVADPNHVFWFWLMWKNFGDNIFGSFDDLDGKSSNGDGHSWFPSLFCGLTPLKFGAAQL